MKVKKVIEVQKKYNFEAPLFNATHKSGIGKSVFEREVYSIDLNALLMPNPKNCFLVKVSGESMIKENIHDGDVLIIDKVEPPKDGKIVIASLNGEMTVKKYRIIEGKTYLFAANDRFLPIEIGDYIQFQIQGVVKHVIRSL
jgi:DNA polymerase V